MLKAIRDQRDITKNDDMRYFPIARRVFHRDRSYAILLGLVDTACRIGEMMNLKVEDVRFGERQLLIRENKGKEPRTLPVSREWLDALNDWLRTRKRIMAEVAKGDDPGWLFLSEYGERMDESQFTKSVKRTSRKAGLSEDFTLHGLRRYSLNRLAKHNRLHKVKEHFADKTHAASGGNGLFVETCRRADCLLPPAQKAVTPTESRPSNRRRLTCLTRTHVWFWLWSKVSEFTPVCRWLLLSLATFLGRLIVDLNVSRRSFYRVMPRQRRAMRL